MGHVIGRNMTLLGCCSTAVASHFYWFVESTCLRGELSQGHKDIAVWCFCSLLYYLAHLSSVRLMRQLRLICCGHPAFRFFYRKLLHTLNAKNNLYSFMCNFSWCTKDLTECLMANCVSQFAQIIIIYTATQPSFTVVISPLLQSLLGHRGFT